LLETVNTTPCKTERYLNIDLSYTLRKQFAKFKCSSHKLNIELGRHTETVGKTYFVIFVIKTLYVLRTNFMHFFNV